MDKPKRGRPPKKESERKKQVAIKLYDWQREMILDVYGSVQNWVNFNYEILERETKKGA